MRNPSNRFLMIFVLVAMLAVTGCDDDDDGGMTTPTQSHALVRVGHLSPDTGLVDVLVNDQVQLEDVDFTDFSNYIALDAGTYNVKVTPANQNATIAIDADVTVMDGVAYTILATGRSGDDSLGATVLVDDLAPVASNANLRFVHASPDAPNVDITLPGGDVLFDDVAFGAADEDRLTVPGGTYDLQVRVANTATVALWFEDVEVASDAVYTVYAIGELGEGTLRAVVTVDDAFAGSQTVELTPATTDVRVAHLSPDAPNVDVWVDGVLVDALVNVPFETVSDYLSLTAGTHSFTVVETGTTEPAVIEATLTLDPDVDYTVAAKGLLGSTTDPIALAPTVVTYGGSEPTSGQALVRFAHGSPDAPAVDVRVQNGPTLFSSTSFRGVTDFLGVDAGTYDLEVVLSSNQAVALTVPNVVLTDGEVVTIYAIGLAGDDTLEALPVLD